MNLTSITPTPEQLKALTHPVRVRILGMLRIDGPATATTLATRLGLNTGATSYHLRQLAQRGFVVDDAERGNGRERWWRAAHRYTTTDTGSGDTVEERDTMDAYLQSVVVVMTDLLQRSVEELAVLPEEWRETTTYSDWVLRLTPARARRLVEHLVTEMGGVEEEAEGEDEGEDAAAPYVVQISAFPYPGKVWS
ncbi:ArsR/SmtB family transcription factor [Nocardioides sp.]|uniref:ArsR/SmtB family transcription factor n=1 Tax=Nocardioides sp. TaxID=35761 RepID=UPI002EDABDF8